MSGWLVPAMAIVGVVGAIGFATVGRLTNFSAVRLPLAGRLFCAAVWLVSWLLLPVLVWSGVYEYRDGPDCRSRNVIGCFSPSAETSQ